MSTFPERLKIMQGNKTIEQFAKQLGVSRTNLYGYLCGYQGKHVLPKIDFMEKVATAYPNTSLRWLVTGKGPWFTMTELDEEKLKLFGAIFSDEDFMEIVEILHVEKGFRKPILEILNLQKERKGLK
jgi:transcriptional regulator with XRE-family HTH domain